MIKPMPGYVLVEPLKEEMMSGAVALPEITKDKPSRGKVIAIGNKYIPENTGITLNGWNEYKDFYFTEEIKVNNMVIYKKWVNQEVHHEGKDYLLIKFEDILAVIE